MDSMGLATPAGRVVTNNPGMLSDAGIMKNVFYSGRWIAILQSLARLSDWPDLEFQCDPTPGAIPICMLDVCTCERGAFDGSCTAPIVFLFLLEQIARIARLPDYDRAQIGQIG